MHIVPVYPQGSGTQRDIPGMVLVQHCGVQIGVFNPGFIFQQQIFLPLGNLPVYLLCQGWNLRYKSPPCFHDTQPILYQLRIPHGKAVWLAFILLQYFQQVISLAQRAVIFTQILIVHRGKLAYPNIHKPPPLGRARPYQLYILRGKTDHRYTPK
jgi:hypothetical protein